MFKMHFKLLTHEGYEKWKNFLKYIEIKQRHYITYIFKVNIV